MLKQQYRFILNRKNLNSLKSPITITQLTTTTNHYIKRNYSKNKQQQPLVIEEFSHHNFHYHIQPLTKEYEEQCAIALSVIFSSQEPLTQALGILPTDLFPFAKYICKIASEDNHATIAIDKESKMLLGFMISEDYIKSIHGEYPEPPKNVNKNFLQILNLLKKLSLKHFEDYPEDKKLVFEDKPKHTVLHLICGGMYPFFEKRGIMTRIVNSHLKFMKKEFGYKKAFAETTNVGSKRACERNGLVTKTKLYYKDLEIENDNGELIKPFVHMKPPSDALEMIWGDLNH
ncbi:hypothetical protein ABK040_008958 [Willaertia magna]